jgi:hypothetical protein
MVLVSLCPYVPPNIFNKLTGLQETCYDFHAARGHLNLLFHNFQPLIIPTFRPRELVRWEQHLCVCVCVYVFNLRVLVVVDITDINININTYFMVQDIT